MVRADFLTARNIDEIAGVVNLFQLEVFVNR